MKKTQHPPDEIQGPGVMKKMKETTRHHCLLVSEEALSQYSRKSSLPKDRDGNHLKIKRPENKQSQGKEAGASPVLAKGPKAER
jgi:hypothetical protein